MARTDPETKGARGVSAFAVEAGPPSLSLGKPERKMGQQGAHVCDVVFDNCRVPADAVIGGVEGQGFKTAMKVLDKGRLSIAAACTGLADRILRDMVAYAVERKQFGQAIAGFQLLQGMFAASKADIEAARALVLDASRRRDAGTIALIRHQRKQGRRYRVQRKAQARFPEIYPLRAVTNPKGGK